MLMFERGGRSLLSTRRVLLILPIWLATSVWMWSWWFSGQTIGFMPLYVLLTVAILYEYVILPSTFLYFVLKAKKPRRRKVLSGKKVALITLCVPSQESIDVVEQQLVAMTNVTYPHDSWILDEGNSKQIKKLAKKYGVKHFTRKGIKKYNQPDPPYKAKTKAGNVNAWLDRVKRYKYEYFVQLDIDHLPKPEYLHKTLGFFRDPKVAWVQAPSIYKNTQHWTARGAAEMELIFQGPLQMGFYGHSETPFIIGSHSTYRMSAIREIGGYQPTRAEDHLDTVALASNGWKGVFLPEIIAEGDGPETLNTYLAQHFAWAYSMFQVLLYHSPRLLRTMSLRRKLQFLFAQTWYPLWSLAYMIMFFVPIIALTTDHPVLDTNGAEFLTHYLPMFAATFLIWWAARPLMQPKGLRLSWRGILLHAARWPVIVRAVLSAGFRIKKPYMITPKGKFAQPLPTVKLYRPYLLLGFISAASIAYASYAYGYRSTFTQMFFASMNVVFAILVCTIDLDLRMRHTTGKTASFRPYWLKPVAAVMSLLIASAIIVSSTMLKDAATYAATIPSPVPDNIAISALPPWKLTDKQIMEQLSVDTHPQIGDKAIPVGIYDPTRKIRTRDGYIRHTFIDWRENRYLAEELLTTERLDGVPLVTVEPRGEKDGQKLLKDIADGSYDKRLNKLISIMAAAKEPVYVRFAHEMDLPKKLYPWGGQDPALYISAYRHVVNLARSQGANNLKWVWSPAGNPNAAAYYPGDDVVDVVGTTILYDRFWYSNYHPSFSSLSQMRRWLQSYNKPVWVVEFGAGKSNRQFQDQLIKDAITNFRSLGFSALVYLNIPDANLKEPNYLVSSLSVFGNSLKPAIAPVAPLDIKLASSLGDGKGRGFHERIKNNQKIEKSAMKLEFTYGLTGSNGSNKLHLIKEDQNTMLRQGPSLKRLVHELRLTQSATNKNNPTVKIPGLNLNNMRFTHENKTNNIRQHSLTDYLREFMRSITTYPKTLQQKTLTNSFKDIRNL